MNPDLDRAVDACVAQLAGATLADGAKAEFSLAVLEAIRRMPDGMARDGAIDRERLRWLTEQIMHRLTVQLDEGIARTGLDAEAKAAIATELRGVFDRIMATADRRL